jgi:hypothetical protein
VTRSPRLLALLLLTPACSPPPRCPDLPAAAPPPSASATATAAPPSGPRLSIALRPRPSDGKVEVEIRAVAPPEALTTFSITPDGGLASVHLTRLADARGPIEAQPAAQPDGRIVLTMPRPASGEVTLAYAVDGKLRPHHALPGVDPDPNRFQASGEPLLFLPDGLDDREVNAAITVDPEAYVIDDGGRTRIDAASSFGVGKTRDAVVRGRELRRGFYMAGSIGRARFDAAEGHDEAAWLGYTSFDPRPIAADVAAFRTAVRELFKGGEETPLTLLVVPDERPPGAFVAARRARSVVVHVGTGEAWTGAVRIAVATEVLHGWIGERLWIGPDDPAHEAASYWFTEGVARHLARDLLFRFGVITGREMLDEVHGLIGVTATSPLRAEGNAALAAHARDPQVVPLLVARGALYAARVNALIRARGKGDRNLADILRALFQKARERRGPLPTSAWIEAVTAELGAAEADAFRRIIEEGRAEDLPENALGPCFRRAPRTWAPYDLGFDESTLPDKPIAGLRRGGPAERAGLRPGDVLVEKEVTRGRSDVPAIVKVSRGGKNVEIKYLPAGPSTRAQGFARKPDVAEEACTK